MAEAETAFKECYYQLFSAPPLFLKIPHFLLLRNFQPTLLILH